MAKFSSAHVALIRAIIISLCLGACSNSNGPAQNPNNNSEVKALRPTEFESAVKKLKQNLFQLEEEFGVKIGPFSDQSDRGQKLLESEDYRPNITDYLNWTHVIQSELRLKRVTFNPSYSIRFGFIIEPIHGNDLVDYDPKTLTTTLSHDAQDVERMRFSLVYLMKGPQKIAELVLEKKNSLAKYGVEASDVPSTLSGLWLLDVLSRFAEKSSEHREQLKKLGKIGLKTFRSVGLRETYFDESPSDWRGANLSRESLTGWILDSEKQILLRQDLWTELKTLRSQPGRQISLDLVRGISDVSFALNKLKELKAELNKPESPLHFLRVITVTNSSVSFLFDRCHQYNYGLQNQELIEAQMSELKSELSETKLAPAPKALPCHSSVYGEFLN